MRPPEELSSADLIRVALDLLEVAERGGSSAHLRRALSAAYYAMFHCLARVAADRLMRDDGTRRNAAARLHVYRALQHQHARRQCLNAGAMALHAEDIRRFAVRFARLQAQRHRADYDPVARFDMSEGRRTIHSAHEGIRLLERASAADQRAFAIWVLLLARNG